MVCPLKTIFGPLTEAGLPEEVIVDQRHTAVDLSFYTPTNHGEEGVDVNHINGVFHYRGRSAD